MLRHASRELLPCAVLLCLLLSPAVAKIHEYGVSDQGALTAVINASRAARTIAARTAAVVDFLHAADHAAVCGHNPRSRIKLVHDGRDKLLAEWHGKLKHQAATKYHFRLDPHNHCVRHVSHNVSDIRTITTDLTDLVAQINTSARSIANAVHLSNWARPVAFLWTSYETDGIKCDLAGFSSVRRNTAGRPQWYLKVGITNEPETLYLPFLQRQYVLEHIHATATPSGPVLDFPANISAYLPRGSLVPEMTTIFAMYGGKPNPSQFYAIDEKDIVSFRDAQLMGKKQVDLASEDVLPSNAIILIMPIVMNFIPISAVAEVGTLGTLVYVLCTDILTSVPLAIKGFELIHVASKVHIAANSWILGHPTVGDAIAEHWLAKCRSDDRFRIIGIVFLFFALFTMVLGIALEIIVAKVVARRRRNAGICVVDADHKWMLKSACGNCQCHVPFYPASTMANKPHGDLEASSFSLSGQSRWWDSWYDFWPRQSRSDSYEDRAYYEYAKEY